MADIKQDGSDASHGNLLLISPTGCIKGFFEVGKSVENDIKTTNPISIFCALKSVMKFKLPLLCHSLFLEKYNFYYTFQGT